MSLFVPSASLVRSDPVPAPLFVWFPFPGILTLDVIHSVVMDQTVAPANIDFQVLFDGLPAPPPAGIPLWVGPNTLRIGPWPPPGPPTTVSVELLDYSPNYRTLGGLIVDPYVISAPVI